MVHRVLQHGDHIIRREMVHRSEHRAKSRQLFRNVARVHGFRAVGERAVPGGARTVERTQIRVLVRQAHFNFNAMPRANIFL